MRFGTFLVLCYTVVMLGIAARAQESKWLPPGGKVGEVVQVKDDKAKWAQIADSANSEWIPRSKIAQVAQPAEPAPVVLTPTKLYDLIEALQKETHSLKSINMALNKRVKLLEDFLGDANTQGALANIIEQQKYKISELERKVAGMQKQITILHARKADK